jgi:hypothetical protein
VSVLSAEVDFGKVLLASESGAHTDGFEAYFKVSTVVDDYVQRVLELLDFIRIAHNLYFSGLIRL